MASTSIFDIIIDKFYYKKKLYLVVLFKIDKDLKISFYCIILFFSLTVHLWIKSDRKSLLNVKEIV